MLDRFFDLVVGCLRFFKFWAVVDAWDLGVRFRLERNPRPVGPGLHWLIPFGVDRIQPDLAVSRPSRPGQQLVTLACGKTVHAEMSVNFRVHNVIREVVENDNAECMVTDECLAASRRNLQRLRWDEVTDPVKAEELEAAVYREARAYGFKVGIEVESVKYISLAKVIPIHIVGRAA